MAGKSGRVAQQAFASRRQSSRPIEASENRPSAGAVSFARATLNFAARSGPNHGLARAPFTGLRVVATSSVGLVVSSAASKRAPVPAIDAHPSSANTDAVDASTRNTLRRDTASQGFIISIADATLEKPNHHSAGAWLEPYPGNSRAVMRPWRGSFVLSAMELCFQDNGCDGPSAKTLSTSIGNILLRKVIPDAFPLLVREPNRLVLLRPHRSLP